MPFPREQPIEQHDLIAAAEGELFQDFDAELDDAGYQETRTDFDFTEVPLPGASFKTLPLHGGQSHVVARPKPGVGLNVWVRDGRQSTWHESAQVDSRGDVVDQNGAKFSSSQVSPQVGACSGCGTSTLLPNGTTAVFCPSCGQRQPAFTVPVISPHALAGQLAAALGNQCMACGVQSSTLNQAGICPSCAVAVAAGTAAMPPLTPPNYNPNRMLGNQKPPPVIPEGLGKSDGKEDFFAFLDEAIEAGRDDAPTETPVKE
jgi:rubrerythrin